MNLHVYSRILHVSLRKHAYAIYTEQKKLRKLCLRAMTNNLKYFRNLEFQNIIKCPFLFKRVL